MTAWAKFDSDGVCEWIVSHRPPRKRNLREVSIGTRPADVWWNGEAVVETVPADLAIPALLETDAEPFTLPLPTGVVATVDGKRQRGTLIIDRSMAGVAIVDIAGAQAGHYRVEVRSYAEQRRAEYPDAAEQLGAAAKLIRALLEGETPPADALAVLEEIEAVKARNPKE